MTLPLTPEDIAVWWLSFKGRFQDWNDIPPESVIVALIEQLGLNQRTAYMRYGPRMEPEGVPAHMINDNKAAPSSEKDNGGPHGTQYPANTGGDLVTHGPGSGPEAAKPGTGQKQGDERSATTNHPLTPADAGWQPSIGCTVEELKKYGGLSDAWGLPDPMYKMIKGAAMNWPPEPFKRLELLSKLTPAQRGELLGTVKR